MTAIYLPASECQAQILPSPVLLRENTATKQIIANVLHQLDERLLLVQISPGLHS